ncbi:MAG: hypothetical protein PHI73_02725 [Patescibacteria group bacterium]|nr:hypothetical protein [Patescibacteria group bacterium]
MSLVVATYVPEGIAMASDSRQSVTISGKSPDGKEFNVETVNSDAVTKTFLLEKQKVGISNFGQDLLGGVPMASHIKRFSEEVLKDTDDVELIARKLVDFFAKEFGKTDCGFHVCGYKKDGKVSVPYVFYCHIGRNEVSRRNLKPDNSLAYGATWSGQADVISGLITPVVVADQTGTQKVLRQPAPIIWDAMPLQDAIDFSEFAIKATIDTIRFQARPKNVGGPVDVLVITPDKASFIKNKTLTA